MFNLVMLNDINRLFLVFDFFYSAKKQTPPKVGIYS